MEAPVTTVPMRLAFHPTSAVDEEIRACELEVLNRWYGDTETLLDEAYGPYVDQTSFLSLTHNVEGVVGFCRLIRPGRLSLKTISDIEREPWGVDGSRAAAAAGIDLTRTWDIATLGIRQEVSSIGSVAASALYHGLVLATRANEIPWVVTIIDRRVRSLLAMIGLPMQALPGTAPAPYMGSAACAPVYTHRPEILDRQRRTAPDAHRLIVTGSGLDGVSVPPVRDFHLSAQADSEPFP
jgi:hypothetical protein